MCRVKNKKTHIVKKHDDELPEEQRLLVSTCYLVYCR